MTRLYKRIGGFIGAAAITVTLSACYQPANYAGVRYGSGNAYASEPTYRADAPLNDAAYTPVYSRKYGIKSANLAPVAHQAAYTPPVNAGGGTVNAVVRPGDTVYAIAKAYGASPKAVISQNGLRYPYTISPGQTLRISPSTHAASSYYTVKRGDNLYRIAKGYGISTANLASMNNISTYAELHPGDKLRVPPGAYTPHTKKRTYRAKKKKYTKKRTYANRSSTYDPSCQCTPPGVTPYPILKPGGYYSPYAGNNNGYGNSGAPQTGGLLGAFTRIIKRDTSAQPISYDGDTPTQRPAVIRKPYSSNDSIENYITPAAPVYKEAAVSRPVSGGGAQTFMLPVRGNVLTQYGPRTGGLFNEGVNISAARNTPVRASADGTVVYSGNAIRGYGNLVLVQHENGYITTYAHNERNTVNKGDAVRKGQVIAYVGDSGQVSGTQLHFGIRKGRQSINPKEFFTEL